MSYLLQLTEAIRHTHGVEATHLETVFVRETWRGEVAWEGEVEVFAVEHPSGATRCYAWGYPSDVDPQRLECVCTLGVAPIVTSPLTAVQNAIRAHRDSKRKRGK